MEAAQTATAAPSLFKRQSSSSPSRRSGSSHRSPALAAQPEDSLPRRFSNHNDEQSKLMYCMEADEELLYAMEAEVEAEEELLVDSLSRKLEKVGCPRRIPPYARGITETGPFLCSFEPIRSSLNQLYRWSRSCSLIGCRDSSRSSLRRSSK